MIYSFVKSFQIKQYCLYLFVRVQSSLCRAAIKKQGYVKKKNYLSKFTTSYLIHDCFRKGDYSRGEVTIIINHPLKPNPVVLQISG